MATVKVVVFDTPLSQNIVPIIYQRAELHMSTNGVLVVRSESGRKVLATYNNNAWFAAESIED